MNIPKRYTITAALPYANGPLHIGHIAGAYLPADTYVRYLRLRGREVAFICGSDEHGAAITLRAKKEGTTPRQIIDTYNALMRDAFRDFGISFDVYHRTSDAATHYPTAQEFFQRLYDKPEADGGFVSKTTEQYFDPEAQQFLADRYIIGTCPRCASDKAYGDQCENCGSTLNPTDLIHPKSVLSGSTPVLRETTHWYLPLDKYQPWLESWLDTKRDSWKTNVLGQCTSWLKGGLQPRAMTRDLDWGVPVPENIPGHEGKKLYVWLDAPIGYISATKQLFKELESGKHEYATPQSAFSTGAADWQLWWKKQPNEADNARLIHFVGKDNIVFHCIIFPSILNAVGDYLVPENVPANEFLNLEGDKISTSRNWAVWLHEYIQDFPENKDSLRYVLTSIAPETKDSEFTWKDFQQRHNSELNAIFSNFVHRVLTLTHKYFEGKIPQATQREAGLDTTALVAGIEDALENFRFREALSGFMDVARLGNKYLTDQEPWKKWKDDQESVRNSLFECLQLIGKLTALAQVFLPETAEKLRAILQLDAAALTWDCLAQTEILPAGHQIGEAKPLFLNIPDEIIAAQAAKLVKPEPANSQPTPAFADAKAVPSQEGKANTANTATATADTALSGVSGAENPILGEVGVGTKPYKPEIAFDDFAKLDLRIGQIVEASRVPKADKLLQFRVDMGSEMRTIVSGVAEHFAPEDLVGKQVLVLANLAPRKIRGVESQGMILYAENAAGKLIRMTPTPEVENGSTVG